jgi:hypothetical protein
MDQIFTPQIVAILILAGLIALVAAGVDLILRRRIDLRAAVLAGVLAAVLIKLLHL